MKKNHLDQARREKQARDEKVHTNSSLKEALVKIDFLEAQVQAIRSLKASHERLIIHPSLKGDKSEATAVVAATDWHLGSNVKREMVNGLNEYDIAIAKKRIERLFEGIVSLTNKERQNVHITELILFLGGDLIDGALHLDTVMSNEIAQPIEQAVLCQSLVESGLNYLLNHGRFKRITVVCADGN